MYKWNQIGIYLFWLKKASVLNIGWGENAGLDWLLIEVELCEPSMGCLLKRFKGIFRTFFSVPSSTTLPSATSSCFSIKQLLVFRLNLSLPKIFIPTASKSQLTLVIRSSRRSILVKCGFRLSNWEEILGKTSCRIELKTKSLRLVHIWPCHCDSVTDYIFL